MDAAGILSVIFLGFFAVFLIVIGIGGMIQSISRPGNKRREVSYGYGFPIFLGIGMLFGLGLMLTAPPAERPIGDLLLEAGWKPECVNHTEVEKTVWLVDKCLADPIEYLTASTRMETQWVQSESGFTSGKVIRYYKDESKGSLIAEQYVDFSKGESRWVVMIDPHRESVASMEPNLNLWCVLEFGGKRNTWNETVCIKTAFVGPGEMLEGV